MIRESDKETQTQKRRSRTLQRWSQKPGELFPDSTTPFSNFLFFQECLSSTQRSRHSKTTGSFCWLTSTSQMSLIQHFRHCTDRFYILDLFLMWNKNVCCGGLILSQPPTLKYKQVFVFWRKAFWKGPLNIYQGKHKLGSRQVSSQVEHSNLTVSIVAHTSLYP